MNHSNFILQYSHYLVFIRMNKIKYTKYIYFEAIAAFRYFSECENRTQRRTLIFR